MNEARNHPRLLTAILFSCSLMLVLTAFLFIKSNFDAHPLVGQNVTLRKGYQKLNSYSSSSITGVVVSIDEAWVTLSYDNSTSLVAIPASHVISIETQD